MGPTRRLLAVIGVRGQSGLVYSGDSEDGKKFRQVEKEMDFAERETKHYRERETKLQRATLQRKRNTIEKEKQNKSNTIEKEKQNKSLLFLDFSGCTSCPWVSSSVQQVFIECLLCAKQSSGVDIQLEQNTLSKLVDHTFQWGDRESTSIYV